MFQRKTKKKPPPRPPPPKLDNYRSKSTLNLTQPQVNLLEWSPPGSPRHEPRQVFGGSVSSSFSSSASSLASSKRSFENDFNPSCSSWTTTTNESKEHSPNLLKPRIIRTQPQQAQIKITKTEARTDGSPPMPSIPPPSPPKGDLDIVTPYGIALYDFPATQPGDLPLQIDDVVLLLRRINKDWLYGRVGDLEGIFPQNFIRIEVPLPEPNRTVTVLNEYNPPLPNMLKLTPGQKVRIISETSSDWLYGELNGQTGQFPRNCVILDP